MSVKLIMNNENLKNKKALQVNSEHLKETSTTEESMTVPHPTKETGGRTQGLEPTRYGDWEFKGRCIDF